MFQENTTRMQHEYMKKLVYIQYIHIHIYMYVYIYICIHIYHMLIHDSGMIQEQQLRKTVHKTVEVCIGKPKTSKHFNKMAVHDSSNRMQGSGKAW